MFIEDTFLPTPYLDVYISVKNALCPAGAADYED